MDRRSFLGRLLGGVAGSALACRVEEVPASALKHLDKVPPICLDFQPNHLWVTKAKLEMFTDSIDISMSNGFRDFLPGLMEYELEATFRGPGCMNLFQYLQDLTGKSFTWGCKSPGSAFLK